MTTDKNSKEMRILMVDDDDDDYLLTRKALAKSPLCEYLERVKDGEELFDYLEGKGKFKAKGPRRPSVILLDLNMPRMDGREALTALKENENYRSIPVVVFTTSKAEEDIVRSYHLGVNSFITKPVTYEGLLDVMSVLDKYWFNTVELPHAAKT